MASLSSSELFSYIKNRRTIYALSKSSPIPNEKIQSIVSDALLHSPSSFNSQTTRVVVLFGAEHDKLWEITKEVLKAIVPAEAWASSEARLNGFQKAYGTALFFDDRSAVQAIQEKFAIYAERFPPWAGQTNAITQYIAWTALEAEGLGANLQHYNPLIDQKVAAEWNLPKEWELNAQLVFGKKEGGAGEKAFQPLEERFKVFGA